MAALAISYFSATLFLFHHVVVTLGMEAGPSSSAGRWQVPGYETRVNELNDDHYRLFWEYCEALKYLARERNPEGREIIKNWMKRLDGKMNKVMEEMKTLRQKKSVWSVLPERDLYEMLTERNKAAQAFAKKGLPWQDTVQGFSHGLSRDETLNESQKNINIVGQIVDAYRHKVNSEKDPQNFEQRMLIALKNELERLKEQHQQLIRGQIQPNYFVPFQFPEI